MTMTSIAPQLAHQQQQIDPAVAQQLIQGQLAQQQALMAQQYLQQQLPQQQYPSQQYPQVQQYQQIPQYQQQLAPYGFLGDLAGAVLPQAGAWVGQQLGSPQLGQQFGGIAGQLAQRFSPWQAGPQPHHHQAYPQQPYQQQPYPQQMYPQQAFPQQGYQPQPYPQQQMMPYGVVR